MEVKKCFIKLNAKNLIGYNSDTHVHITYYENVAWVVRITAPTLFF